MKIFTLSLFAFLILLTTQVVFAANPGDLDLSFGSGGKVYALPTNFMPADDVAVQADGKLVLVGKYTRP